MALDVTVYSELSADELSAAIAAFDATVADLQSVTSGRAFAASAIDAEILADASIDLRPASYTMIRVDKNHIEAGYNLVRDFLKAIKLQGKADALLNGETPFDTARAASETRANRTISVPRSTEAMERLDLGMSEPIDLIEIGFSDDEFYSLYKTPVFNSLNTFLSVNIDDFEDDSICGVARLKMALELVEGHNRNLDHPQITRLKEMIEHAIRLDTGVFFFF